VEKLARREKSFRKADGIDLVLALSKWLASFKKTSTNLTIKYTTT